MKRVLAIAILILCALPFTVIAQDATLTPPPVEGELPAEELPPAEPTLESVTADPASYYGQEVSLEGVVEELINIRSFLFGEGAAIDDDQMIVVNNSGQEFNIGVTRDARVLVTGTVYPAFDQGGWDQIMQLPMGGMAEEPMDTTTGETAGDTGGETTGEMEATDEALTESEPGMETTDEAMTEMEPTAAPMEGETDEPMESAMPAAGVTLAEYPVVVLQERFPSHTILVVDSVDAITFVEEVPVEGEVPPAEGGG